MRTTIEMKPDHRVRLLEIVARRGQKGLSAVVSEAIEDYLDTQAARNKRRNKRLKRALRAGGSLSKREASALRRRTEAIRRFWR